MAVSWTPGSDHGSTITSYTLTEVGGAGTWTCTGSPCEAYGLQTGGTYSFQVVATNAAGSSEPSAASTPKVLSVTPSRPTGVTLAGGQGEVTASWAPVDADGWSVTYEVQLDDGQTQTTRGTSTTFSVDSGSYVAKVRAVIPGGGASEWATSNVAGPWSAPGKPEVRKTDGGVNVSWKPVGQAAGVTYTVNISGDASSSVSAGSSTSAYVALSPGSYSVTVTASQGGSSAESPSTDFQVTGAPSPPSAPVIEARGDSGTLNVVTPAYASAGNGWTAGELRVEYSADGRRWTEGPNISGLQNGTAYTVQARVVAPDGSVSSSTTGNSATPYGPPTSPTMHCEAGDTTVTCSWSGGSDGGMATTYELSGQKSGTVAASGSETFTVGHGAKAELCVTAKQGANHGATNCDSATTAEEYSRDYEGGAEWDAWGVWTKRLTVSLRGWPPNSQVTCRGTTWWYFEDSTYSTTVTTDSRGNYSDSPVWTGGGYTGRLYTRDYNPGTWFRCE